jgi:hypothetical protein
MMDSNVYGLLRVSQAFAPGLAAYAATKSVAWSVACRRVPASSWTW